MKKQRWMLRSIDHKNDRGAEGVDNPFAAMRQAFGCVMPVEAKAMGGNATVMRTNWLREEFFSNPKGWLKPFAIVEKQDAPKLTAALAIVMAEDAVRAMATFLLHEKPGLLVEALPTDFMHAPKLLFQEVEYVRPVRPKQQA